MTEYTAYTIGAQKWIALIAHDNKKKDLLEYSYCL
jgi:methylglyoxal synthase